MQTTGTVSRGKRTRKASMRGPVRMRGEEAVDETDVIREEETEAEAQQAGAGDEPTIEPGKTGTGEGKRKSEGKGDEHHSGNGAKTKKQ